MNFHCCRVFGFQRFWLAERSPSAFDNNSQPKPRLLALRSGFAQSDCDMPRSRTLSSCFSITPAVAGFMALLGLLCIPTSTAVDEQYSHLVTGFRNLLYDMKFQLNNIRRATDIGLLDRTYGYVLGGMLQSTFLMNELGRGLKARTIPSDEFMILENAVTHFDDEFQANYSVYGEGALPYAKRAELKQAMKDMEDPFKFKLRYMLRTFRRGSDGLERFVDYWHSLTPDRNGLLHLLNLVNETASNDFVSIWKRNMTLCDPARMRPLFFEIQMNIFREFISREIFQGMTPSSVRPKNYEKQISNLNLRMMQVMNICWQQQVKRRAEQAYALYYQERFSGSRKLQSTMLPLVIIPILSLVLLEPSFFLWFF